MANTLVSRYLRDIKISAIVALIFIIALFLLFLANSKFGFSERLVDFFVIKFFGGI